MVKQAIIKTPVKDEYLEFFQNCPVKYMYMPIVYNMEELRKVLTYDNINIVGIGSVSLLHIGVVYFLVRIIGKYAGAFIGCAIAGKDKLVRNYLGLALIPQAGVAIGLAAMGARTLGGETGNILETVILASSVLYELIGPACAKLSLYLSKSYSNKLEEIVEIPEEEGAEQKTELELLIQRIQAIQEELPKHDDPFYEDEKAFSEAAEEHYAMTGIPNPNLYRRKRGAF